MDPSNIHILYYLRNEEGVSD